MKIPEHIKRQKLGQYLQFISLLYKAYLKMENSQRQKWAKAMYREFTKKMNANCSSLKDAQPYLFLTREIKIRNTQSYHFVGRSNQEDIAPR